jgi:hypothetical protein
VVITCNDMYDYKQSICLKPAEELWGYYSARSQHDLMCYPVATGSLSTLGVSRFCEKYPAVLATLQRSLLELVCKYQKQVLGCAIAHVHHSHQASQPCSLAF